MTARDNIRCRLRAAPQGQPVLASDIPGVYVAVRRLTPTTERAASSERFCEKMAFWRGEVVRVTHRNWAETVNALGRAKQVKSLLYGANTTHSAALEASEITAKPYDRPIDEGKPALFRDTDAGFTSTRGGIAETGTRCLVEKEGKVRVCFTAPDLRFAITGTEKVVEKLEHVPSLLCLLRRSATGQAITTYFNMLCAPRRTGQKDGPMEVHLVLLDNKHKQPYADEHRCARDLAMHSLRGVHELLTGLYVHRQPCLWHDVSRPAWRNHFTAHDGGPGGDACPADGFDTCDACDKLCPVKSPISDLLVRLRDAATHDARPGREPLVGQGAAKSALMDVSGPAGPHSFDRRCGELSSSWRPDCVS